jgi:SAM-dependent methyltransferase
MVTPEQVSDDNGLIPPADMLYDGSSSREDFIAFGESFCRHFLLDRAQLHPSAAVLDLGCGNGGVARPLTRILNAAGRYEGLDIRAEHVAWLKERYEPYPNFRFIHADIRNKMYNPGGAVLASDYHLPFDDSIFDLVLLKSVFTHMLPADMRAYLHEVSRVLRTGGRSVVTYFLLNSESRRLIGLGRDKLGLLHEFEPDGLCKVADPAVPESAVAHDEQRVRQFHSDAGLIPIELHFGDWCGRPPFLGLQDAVIAMKE